jgi:hypothetical protein
MAETKCTLMSNTPHADVELLFRNFGDSAAQSPPAKGQKGMQTQATMRIRLSRQRRSLEIARYVPGPWGGEWTKKVMQYLCTGQEGEFGEMAQAEWDGLLVMEREGVECLVEFLRVCEVVDSLEVVRSGDVDKARVVMFDRSRTDDLSRLAPSRNLEQPAPPIVKMAQERADSGTKTSCLSTLTNATSLRTPLVNVASRPETFARKAESHSQPQGQCRLFATQMADSSEYIINSSTLSYSSPLHRKDEPISRWAHCY